MQPRCLAAWYEALNRTIGCTFFGVPGLPRVLAFGYTLFRNYKDPGSDHTMTPRDAPFMASAAKPAENLRN